LVQNYYEDVDGDGYGDAFAKVTESCVQPKGMVSDFQDCNDDDATVHPGADEVCDGIDNDCNGQVDELGMGCKIQGVCYLQFANKLGQPCNGNYGACAVKGVLECAYSANGPSLICSTDIGGSESKASEEVCDNVDNNCDGQTDEGCDLSEVDADNDGFKALVDCDDNDASVFPGSNTCPVLEGLTKDSYKLVVVFVSIA